jgi:hypothetical protein
VVRALKEGDPDFLLQLVDLLAQGRLGDVHQFGRMAEVECLCHCDEVSEVPQFHGLALK